MEILTELDDVVAIIVAVLLAFGFLIAYWACMTLISSIGEMVERSRSRIRIRTQEHRTR